MKRANFIALLRKDRLNTFAQKQYFIFMTLMAVGLSLWTGLARDNWFFSLFPMELLAYAIPSFVAMSCASQLVVNNYLEDVKSNISISPYMQGWEKSSML